MRKNTTTRMKRLATAMLAMGMLAGSAFPAAASSATSAPSFAEETKSIDSAELIQDQSGLVYATVTETPLKQLKVTLPIRLDFVIYKPVTGTTEFLCGDYTINVDPTSEIGVCLDKVTVSAPPGSTWSLLSNSAIQTSTNVKDVCMNLAGKELKFGSNEVSPESEKTAGTTDLTKIFYVGVGASKSLGLSGTPAGNLSRVTSKAAEKAFQVTYTISQFEPKP